jgi:hypothetical protein
VALAFLVAGCSASSTRKVTGTASWQGTPIAEGTINLIPLDPAVPAVSGKIVDGKFELLALPGEKKVEIYATRAAGAVVPEMGMAGREMYIPEEYNARSKLTMNVSASGDNHFTFDLPDKPK